MVFGKKSKEKELENAKKLLQEAEALEKAKQEQAQPTGVIETGAKTAQPTKEELETIKERVDYYVQNYRGIFSPNDAPAQTINPIESEIACLLFGILQEIKELKELVKQG